MIQRPSNRRLVAILAADVAGYSRLMEQDETGTLNRLRACLRDVIDPEIVKREGRLVKTTGDGILVEFPSVVGAVACAVAVQRTMLKLNADLPVEQRVEFRVGIHQGDVIAVDGDIFGHGVNVAARLEGLAVPGGICISGRVHADATGRVEDVEFDDLGSHSLKNIAAQVHVFAIRLIRGDNGSVIPRQSHALSLPDKPSLAVLPFQNMSGDPEQEYFVDGMVEEITTAIARLPWLFVIARNSSFTYKNKSTDLRQVGRELGVRYVLEGSVRKAGKRVRITGQLIDATTAAHIWADRIDGSLDDVFALQDQVASNVVGAIEPKLRLSEIKRAERKPPASLDAYDLYLRALAQIHKMARESWCEAIQLLGQALQIDPSYAPAGGLLSWCRAWQQSHGWETLSGELIAEVVGVARQAAENGKDDPDALSMAGWAISYFTGDHIGSLSLIERALALNTNSAVAWNARGWVMNFLARPDPALESFERAMRLSPLDPLAYLCKAGLAIAHMLAKRYSEGIDWVDQALREQPRYAAAIRYKASLCGLLGRTEEGRECIRRVLELYPGLTIASLKHYLISMNIPELGALVLDGMRRAGLPEE